MRTSFSDKWYLDVLKIRTLRCPHNKDVLIKRIPKCPHFKDVQPDDFTHWVKTSFTFKIFQLHRTLYRTIKGLYIFLVPVYHTMTDCKPYFQYLQC